MASDRSQTIFAIVRFHHIVENSLVERTFRHQIADGRPVTVHLPPDTRQPGQNLQEAVAMLLNAGVYGRRAEVFASARELDYFSVLDLALYSIQDSGKRVPVIFKTPENSEGYRYAEFAGADRRDPECAMHFFNFIERQQVTTFTDVHLMMADFPDFDRHAVQQQIDDVILFATSRSSSDEAIKEQLYKNLSALAADIYTRAPLHLLIAALIQAARVSATPSLDNLASHGALLAILLSAIDTHNKEEFSLQGRDMLRHAVTILESAGGRSEELRSVRSAAQALRERIL